MIVGVIDDIDLNHPQRAGSKYFQYESSGLIGVANKPPCAYLRVESTVALWVLIRR